MVEAYWYVGRTIVEEEQRGEVRAEYGAALLKNLSIRLTAGLGTGFDERELRRMRQFNLSFPIRDALRPTLAWTHYRLLIRVNKSDASMWYLKDTADQNWSTRALDRQLNCRYYFVARQQRISTETKDFFVDLVFFNYILKCFVLVDLKTGELTHQTIGQMDMYVRLFEDTVKGTDDNPTDGIILCAEKDHTVVKYSVLNENRQLFVSKYSLYLPTEEALREALVRERALLVREQSARYRVIAAL